MKGKGMEEVRDILFQDGEEKDHNTSESLQDWSARPSDWWEVVAWEKGWGILIFWLKLKYMI